MRTAGRSSNCRSIFERCAFTLYAAEFSFLKHPLSQIGAFELGSIKFRFKGIDFLQIGSLEICKAKLR